MKLKATRKTQRFGEKQVLVILLRFFPTWQYNENQEDIS